MIDRVGQQLGNYRLVRLLGQGGFAEVYLGEHVHLDTQAAIKVLRVQLGRGSIEQFRTEARTIAHLVHPSIVRVLDYDVEESTPFLVMDYAPNGTLRHRHPHGVLVPLVNIVSYITQVAAALQHAHNQKLIHRDIKPENMLLSANNEVLLSDFGIALIAHSSGSQSTQEFAGTVGYMAPEQIQGKPRPASDQYALGVVVYEWLCGSRPFHGSFTEVATQHLLAPLPPLHEKVPAISPAVENVVATALAKEPGRRFASVQDFAIALRDAAEGTRTYISTHPTASTQSNQSSTEATHVVAPPKQPSRPLDTSARPSMLPNVTTPPVRSTQTSMPSTQIQGYFTGWTLKTEGIIAPDERLPWGQTIFVGLQHVLAMFGATVLAPIIMGFNPNTAIFFSGIATLIFFFVVGGRVPSYLGSSFSFIAVVLAASMYSGKGPNLHIDVALGGIITAGVVYAIIGLIVIFTGYRWIEYLMPPAVTGAVVAVIGLNLAPVAIADVSGSQFDTWMGILTVLAVALVAIYAPGPLRRLPILIGGIIGYLIYLLFANAFGFGKPINFTALGQAAWIGLPNFTAPSFHPGAMALIAPVAIILVAENLGHVKAVAAMTGRNLDPYLGRAFLGDGLATIIAASGGGTGLTTYAENIGTMAVTRIYSTVIFIIAAVVAILLGFCPKFGALIATIPSGVLGGLAIVLFGLIAATAGRIWVQNGVDFSKSRNLITIAVALTLGAGNLVLNIGGFALGGIGTASFAAIIIYQLLRERDADVEESPELEVEA